MGVREQGIVIRTLGSAYDVQGPDGVVRCVLRGRLRRQRDGPQRPVIGDHVEFERVSPREGAIVAILPRRTALVRREPLDPSRAHVLAANLDQIVAVFAAVPEPDLFQIDRYLAVAEANHLLAILCMNKMDLVEDQESFRARFAEYEALGYPVLYTSAVTGTGLEALRERLQGKITAFIGPSGAGKSSLLNALQPGLALKVGSINPRTGMGRHTTTHSELIPFDGGYLADTPGLRDIGVWGIPPEDLAVCFPEMRPYLGQCEFSDCLHLEEPGCAIRRAVARGKIRRRRYESYQRILIEQQVAWGGLHE
ncbi:ribosome small subunit-dependent GTPase A [Thermoflexus sp.]|uniref:ribosome small subunit-dependent GTPase A n=2 Tax=Thermoflexus sp. TaxID=1969742 RepID=UPI0025D17233|nr:ribosome small subunit-dependent GTPase A [Thermoflexus sp.]MCS7351687.1 ribosome small subunit-dependent GTPase A [Thermoflexus sp.]MCX7689773.1 ribosome small subunit-dependent GTPase A [Thermoflexus sp.]MDW8181145.1 ribosome small subunit-dependent GTPase A [Anaerolineae bacterium]